MGSEEETVEQIRARVQDLILDQGYAIHYVNPVNGRPYGYTIGRTLHGRPELLISGLPAESMRHAIEAAIAADNAEPIEMGRPVTGVFGPMLAFPITIDPWRAEMHLAIASFGIITALQLLWPDDAGHFPGDPDYMVDPSTQQVFC